VSHPWSRQRDNNGDLEPNLWFDRFVRFLHLGPSRSLVGLYNQYVVERDGEGTRKRTSAPGAWWTAYKSWGWKERAEAWDEYQRQVDKKRYEDERKKAKAERLAVIRTVKARLAQAAARLDLDDPNSADITRLLRVVCQEERAEYDDEPTQRISTTDTVVVIGGVDLNNDV